MYRYRNSRTSRGISKWRVAGVAGLFLGLAVSAWWCTNYRILSVQSDSMAPYLARGDVVVVRGDALSPQVGDVVSYRSPMTPKLIITHRIVAVDVASRTFIAKGDNTAIADLPVRQSLIIGSVIGHVAFAGRVLDWLRSPYGLAVCVYLPALGIVAAEFRRLSTHYDFMLYRNRNRTM